MSPSIRSTVFLLVACLLLCGAHAFNITKILEKESDYSTFNQLLTDTGLAKEINGRKTITVLAVPNDAIGGLSSKPKEELKAILKTHVILDYYDKLKLNNLKKSTEMTTMFQSTGVAHHSQGFLNVTKGSDGVYFGSDVKDAPRDSKLLDSLASQPYNISVLSISQPIATPGLNADAPISAPPPKKSKAPSPDTAESPEEETVESPPEGESPAEAPAPEDGQAPQASSPKADDQDADTADKKDSSSPGKLFVSSFALAAILASSIAAFQ